ncbi:hypothetical protein LCGC14_2585400, partial [marine sediment metagenome]
ILIETSQAVSNIDSLTDSIDKSTKSTQDQGKATDQTSDSMLDMADGVGIAGVSVGALRKAFQGVTTVMKVGVTSLKSFKVALAATGIGLFVIAIGALAQHFTDSEKGANKLNKILTKVGIVFGNVTDIVGNFGKLLFAALTGNFEEVKEAWAEIREGVTGFIEQTQIELEQGEAVANMEAELLIARREFIVEQQRAESIIADLRLKARMEEEFTSKQRLQFLRQARDIQDDVAKLETRIAKDELDIVRTRNSFSKSKTANLQEEAEAEANLFRIETQRLNKNRQVQRELIRVLAQMKRDQIELDADFRRGQIEMQDVVERGLDVRIRGAKEFHEMKLDFTKKEVASTKDAAQTEVDIQHAKRDAILGVASQTFNAIGGALREGSIAQKVAAIAQVIIDGVIAVIKMWAVLGPLAPFSIPIVGAAVGIAIKKITNVPVPPAPRFAVGGFIEGPNHAMGGVNINAEGGEGM